MTARERLRDRRLCDLGTEDGADVVEEYEEACRDGDQLDHDEVRDLVTSEMSVRLLFELGEVHRRTTG